MPLRAVPTRPPTVAQRLFGTWVARITPGSLRADLQAGQLGAVRVLPQSIASPPWPGCRRNTAITAMLPCAVAANGRLELACGVGATNAISLALFAMLSPLAAPAAPSTSSWRWP